MTIQAAFQKIPQFIIQMIKPKGLIFLMKNEREQGAYIRTNYQDAKEMISHALILSPEFRTAARDAIYELEFGINTTHEEEIPTDK